MDQYKDFSKAMTEFLGSIVDAFPEITTQVETANQMPVEELMEYCSRVYPERFFDILYQNEEMFDDDDIDTDFVPGVDFKVLWKFDGVSDATKAAIWKYLQLITFSIVSNTDSESTFGDTAKLFGAINENSFKEKLEETLNNLQNAFKESGGSCEGDGENKVGEDDVPSSDDLHSHIQGMLGGKIGQLANEIAEETALELDIDIENPESANDVFAKVIKNPKKLMGLVKSIGSKLEDKIKSGEMKESELMAEASELMSQMKDMPGMGDIGQMMSSMGMGKKTKLDMGAMQTKLDQNMKMAKTKERMREKIDSRKREKSLQEEVNRLKMELTAVDTRTVDQIMAELDAIPDVPGGTGGGGGGGGGGEKSQPKKKKKKKSKK
tara:strand:+ start:119 stop:1258 length:1140 start_codon:yes stop_codon:yes gene_type:complete